MTTSKENISIYKKDNPDSKNLAVGMRSIQFAHQFTGGETSLDLLNLTTPSLLLSNGFVNASPAEIASAHLSVFGKNLKLALSRGLELKQFVHYLVKGNQIIFLGDLRSSGGALADEILIGEVHSVTTNSVVVGDVRFERGTVPVTSGQTTVNLGVSYKVNANPSNQIGDVKLKLNGIELVRNTGNATASPSADGHYQEIDSGNGYGTTILLNNPPIADGIVSFEMGVRLSSGDLEIWNKLEVIDGILLKLAEDVKDLGPYDITRYLSASPSAIERRLFGDLVQSLVTSKQDKIQHKWQQKFLSSTVTLNTTLGDLTFNNLTIGKTYRVYMYVVMGDSSGPDSQINLDIYNGSTFIAGSNHTSDAATGISNGGYGITSRPFVATATTVTFISSGMSGTDNIVGTGAANATNAILEELPNHVVTNEWT